MLFSSCYPEISSSFLSFSLLDLSCRLLQLCFHCGTVLSVSGPAVHFSSFKPPEATPPPLIGQHTTQVLRDSLSYSDDAIKSLLEQKVVAQNVVT